MANSQEGAQTGRGLPPEESAWEHQANPEEALKTVVPLSAPLAGGVGGLLIWGTACLLQQLFGDDIRLWSVVTFGPPLVILVFSATVALHIGLMGRDFPEAKTRVVEPSGRMAPDRGGRLGGMVWDSDLCSVGASLQVRDRLAQMEL